MPGRLVGLVVRNENGEKAIAFEPQDWSELAIGQNIFTGPDLDLEALREIRQRFYDAGVLARKAAVECEENGDKGGAKTYHKSADAHIKRVQVMNALFPIGGCVTVLR